MCSLLYLKSEIVETHHEQGSGRNICERNALLRLANCEKGSCPHLHCNNCSMRISTGSHDRRKRVIAAWKGVRETPICRYAWTVPCIRELCLGFRDVSRRQAKTRSWTRPGAMLVVDPANDPSCPMLRRETSMTASGRRPPHGPTTQGW